MLRLLAQNGFKLDINADFYDYLYHAGVSFPADTHRVQTIDTDTEVVMSIGGDGTFLTTAKWVGSLHIPLLGVNTGHLGYLAQFDINDMDTLCDQLKRGALRREQRTLLQLDIEGCDDTQARCLTALNDIAILKDDTSSMINVDTWVDDRFLARYRADGLIFSTATGSTAYNMSAGGPLLQPTLDIVAITPVAPHSLTQRPLVIGGDCVVHAVTDTRAARYRVSVDGRSFTLAPGTSLTVRRGHHRLDVLLRTDTDFAATLRSKLGWAQR